MAINGREDGAKRRPWYTVLYIQVLIAILIGICLGYFRPETGVAMQPLGDAFIQLIKMMIAPIIFCTLVHGIASMSDLTKVGRVGLKALVYFELVSTIALAVGLLVGELVQPGTGFSDVVAKANPKDVTAFVTRAKEESVVAHLLAIVPRTFFSAFTEGDVLQVLLVAILSGFAVARMGRVGDAILRVIEAAGQVFFRIIGIIVRAAPIGAFGAMAFTIGKYGIGALWNLFQLVLTLYATSALFVLVVLGAIAWLNGFSILRFLAYIKDEILIVVGTSSSETVLPHMLQKMHRLGASRSVVGLVIPTGYSFNLDGTNIYMTLATLFLAQATHTHLSLGQELSILAIAMLTSKGAAAVTGGGFVTLAATLAIIPDIPIQSLAILIGVDKFMSECRALTNLIGNGVATVVVSRWEGELDRDQLRQALKHPMELGEALEAEPV